MPIEQYLDPEEENRYQNQPWHIRAWRSRWYIMIPIWTFKYWGAEWDDGEKTDLDMAYSFARGMVHYKMNWVYDWEEVKERLRK